jgi:thiol-disulfide isomerase/thioredoxin
LRVRISIMKIIVLYRPKSEQEGTVLDFKRDYKQLRNKDLELVSLDTVEGDNMAKVYDITQYPAFLAIKDDGQLEQMWQGETLPLMNELDYYTMQL